MKKIVLFSGSNSSRSINQRLILYISSLIKEFNINVLDLREYKIPMFSEDIESEEGYSDELNRLHLGINSADGLIVSVPEHNGNMPAFFKNILDWLSRLDRYFLKDKKIFLCSTSPGGRGGTRAMEIAERTFAYFGGEVIYKFSLPSFQKNFKIKIVDIELEKKLIDNLDNFLRIIANKK